MNPDLAFAPISELSRHLRNGDISAPQLIDLFAGRIDRYGEISKAFISLDLQRARARAEAVDPDKELALNGIPYSCKDLFDVEGLATTGGSQVLQDNIADSDAAIQCVRQFEQAACVIVKHANPCGVAVSDSILSAYEKAFSTDPTSAFGGIIAFNRPLDHATARAIIDKQFVEVIVAPEIDEDALAITAEKKNVRVLTT